MVFKRFLSLSFIFATLLVIVSVQTAQRNTGYFFATESKKLRDLREQSQLLQIQLAKKLQPAQMQNLATKKLALRKVRDNQVIYLSGSIAEENN